MKKRTIMKLKSIFGTKKGKRQHLNSAKSSRPPSPEPVATYQDTFRPIECTPPPSRVGPPPSPPVPTHPIAPVPPEPSGPQPLLPCSVCNRTFVPQSLAKHVKICEKAAAKKRKTFDSSRQRREGTDLAQFLPKNFGLPDNSPFLEKSPPTTARPTPKPKALSVRNSLTKGITKAAADLQRCPHCNRAFGVRAFERHVEWCADKAKILPAAATAQPPPHIADAKQRLNARTQYKAPPVRNRRSSQSRDKSSNSRSASVDSSRGVSPPPPREYGDYKHGRARASAESVSSNDHEEMSPHVPVIRNSRSSGLSSGDASVKARQARLARDLSSSRDQEPQGSPIRQSKNNPGSTKPPNKPKSNVTLKKQNQMKKLEDIANKYNERQQKRQEEKAKREEEKVKRDEEKMAKLAAEKIRIETEKALIIAERQKEKEMMKHAEKSQIPILKRLVPKKIKRQIEAVEVCKEENKEIILPNPNKSRPSSNKPTKTIKDIKIEKRSAKPTRKVVKKITKESTMSLDSLEDPRTVENATLQSVGINTELLCPCKPCVIHTNNDNKPSAKKKNISDKLDKSNIRTDKSSEYIPEPKLELLYKNLTMVSSCDIRANNFETDQETSETTLNQSSTDFRSSENFLQGKESTSFEKTIRQETSTNEIKRENSPEKCKESNDTKVEHSETTVELSTEYYEEQYEHDVSDMSEEFGENKFETHNEENDLIPRHGSGETYTKFTENPDDLDEFINLTDKMMGSHNFDEVVFDMDKEIENLHTPKTNSLEAINNNPDNKDNLIDEPKIDLSETFAELKNDLQDLITGAGETAVHEKLNYIEEVTDIEEKRNVCDMEHITIYELKLNEERHFEDMKTNKNQQPVSEKYESVPEFKLPSIMENNRPERKGSCTRKKLSKLYKPNKKIKMLGDQSRNVKEYHTYIIKDNDSDQSSLYAEAPPLKLPRIENKKRISDDYNPFACAARQMKELMSSDNNIPKSIKNCRNPNSTLPILRPKDKPSLSYLNTTNPKSMKNSINKTYQNTPTLQRMKSFGSTNIENTPTSTNTFGGRCSSFRLNRNDKQKSSQKLNTTFTKSSKENISTTEKNYFNRSSTLNRSFSTYTSAYSTPKPKEKIPKISTSYHSFQRTTIKQPIKLDKIKRDDDKKDITKKDFVNLDSILVDDNSSMTDSNYIDPRLINENDNLPINVNTILNNPDIISSMESLLTTENLPAKFESFNTNLQNNNHQTNGHHRLKDSHTKLDKIETNSNINHKTAPMIVDDLSVQYDKIMSSLEQSIASKTSIRDDDSLCEDFDLEEFMTSFDEEIHKHKEKRICSSTTRVLKQCELVDSDRNSEINSICSSPKLLTNGLLPVNKSNSFNFSSNITVGENLFPSSVKRSTSILDSIQKKTGPKTESGKIRHKSDQLEQDIMQSLKEFDNFYESERTENHSNKEMNYQMSQNGTTKRESRVKSEKTRKTEGVANGNHTPNGKSTDSAYSSLNRISPSKLSVCNSKESNSASPLEQITGSDSSGCQKDEIRSVSSEEFLAMERSAELDEPLQDNVFTPSKEIENPLISEKRVSSRASSRRSSAAAWRPRPELSSSGSEASLHPPRHKAAPASPSPTPPAPASAPLAPAPAPARLSRFCHECGSKFPVDTAKFCIECGVKRLAV